MNRYLFLLGLSALSIFSSCSEDETSGPPNQRPVIYEQTFNPPEAISDDDKIGLVKAFDANVGTKLSYTIANNSNDLFEISNIGGALTLKEGKSLDFNDAATHKITVAVSDFEYEALAVVTINVNIAPEFDEDHYEFEVFENIAPDVVIGTITASDVHGDMLTYNITENDNDLFEINEFGEISLVDEKDLDFEAENGQEHLITVSLSDGVYTLEKEVKILVLDVEEFLVDDPASFITKWKITGNGGNISIATNENYQYDYTIDWGDGTVEELTEQDPSHFYDMPGIYTVAIKGDFPAIFMGKDGFDESSKEALISIEQWGDNVWASMRASFFGCTNLAYNAQDVPNLENVSTTELMFASCTIFDGDLNDWNMENVTDMAFMFLNASSFNGDIKDWNVQNVTTFHYTFQNAISFNKDISNWDTQSAESFDGMFNGATVFDQNLGGWKLDNVTGVADMLSNTGMSPENYSNTLIGWAEQMETVQLNGVGFGAAGLQYTCEANAAHDVLTDEYNWAIVDEGLVNPCQ